MTPPTPSPTPIENRDLFEAYQRTGDRRVRNELVERYGGLVRFAVRRFRHRGAEEDDLRQVAYVALLGAIDRFDADRGVQFSTFASQSMEGELKRYLRDRAWAVRPPRRSQELHLELRSTEERLTQQLGRVPLVAELASALGATEDEVLLASEARHAYRAASIDAAPLLVDHAQRADERPADFDQVEVADLVERLLDRLPEGERRLLELRYLEGMSQPAIAEHLGVSQSYLSRLLRRTLSRVRDREDTASRFVGGQASSA